MLGFDKCEPQVCEKLSNWNYIIFFFFTAAKYFIKYIYLVSVFTLIAYTNFKNPQKTIIYHPTING